MSALARQRLTLDHVGPKVEAVVHVFGIHPEQAAEVDATSDHTLKRVPDKAGDIAAADARSAAGGKVKTIEI
jgi:hypothetical protein